MNTPDRPDVLRKVIRETIIEQGGVWELRLQLNTDLDAMPVEHASFEWDKEASSYRPVGRISVAPHMSLGTDLPAKVDENSFFGPWHGLAAHRPLGSVNRLRRQAYEMFAEFRARFNGGSMHDAVGTRAA